MFGDRFFPAVYFGNRYFAPGGVEAPAAEQPTGGSWGHRGNFSTPADILRRRRREERERLEITEAEQRKLDRTAKKIARAAPVKAEGLNLAPATVIAQPAFDALLVALQPSEGEVMALAVAIVERVLFLAELARLEDEEQEMILRLMMEM